MEASKLQNLLVGDMFLMGKHSLVVYVVESFTRDYMAVSCPSEETTFVIYAETVEQMEIFKLMI